MLATATIFIGYVFLSAGLSGPGDKESTPSFKVDLSGQQPGQVRQLLWQDRPVIIPHRTAAQIAALQNSEVALLDRDSAKSQQPAAANNYHRSVSPTWFVAIAVGTDMGCGLAYLPETALREQGIHSALKGAFRDQCRGSLYDLAGRVLTGQSAEKNLAVPVHRWVDGTTLWLGG